MGYILFSSNYHFSISAPQMWNGILEYSYNNKDWEEWDGNVITNKIIYMRGVNNTIISSTHHWSINGKNVKCQGNIENLLDYKSVINNIHPKMKKFCFADMFYDCEALIEAPSLLSNHITIDCYSGMFANCTSLITAPLLSASSLDNGSCWHMFLNCRSLINPPTLLATELKTDCYYGMFLDCISLTTTPLFPNVQIAKEAIINNEHMFDNCPIRFININNKLYDINVLKLL